MFNPGPIHNGCSINIWSCGCCYSLSFQLPCFYRFYFSQINSPGADGKFQVRRTSTPTDVIKWEWRRQGGNQDGKTTSHVLKTLWFPKLFQFCHQILTASLRGYFNGGNYSLLLDDTNETQRRKTVGKRLHSPRKEQQGTQTSKRDLSPWRTFF